MASRLNLVHFMRYRKRLGTRSLQFISLYASKLQVVCNKGFYTTCPFRSQLPIQAHFIGHEIIASTVYHLMYWITSYPDCIYTHTQVHDAQYEIVITVTHRHYIVHYMLNGTQKCHWNLKQRKCPRQRIQTMDSVLRLNVNEFMFILQQMSGFYF